MRINNECWVVESTELWTLRDGEAATIGAHEPSSGYSIAVQLRSVKLPTDEYEPTRTRDGAPVVLAAVVACHRNHRNGNWEWLHLGSATREAFGDLLSKAGAQHDLWYYLTIQRQDVGKDARDRTEA